MPKLTHAQSHVLPIMQSFEVPKLWDPEKPATNAEWHTAIRHYLSEAEDHYEREYDKLTDELIESYQEADEASDTGYWVGFGYGLMLGALVTAAICTIVWLL